MISINGVLAIPPALNCFYRLFSLEFEDVRQADAFGGVQPATGAGRRGLCCRFAHRTKSDSTGGALQGWRVEFDPVRDAETANVPFLAVLAGCSVRHPERSVAGHISEG